MEKLKKIKGFEHMYSISNDGYVFNHKKGKILKSSVNTSGYPMLILRKDNKNHAKMIHRLVALHFVSGMTDVKNEVNHKDGNKKNNHYSNLEWCSRSENALHGFKKGLLVSGSKNNFAKLTEHEVSKIKSLKGQMTQKEIATLFNVSQSNVSYIHSGKSWKY